MMRKEQVKRGGTYVYAPTEADALSGRGQRATLVKVESIVPEGKVRGVPHALVRIEGETEDRHVKFALLFGEWAPYHARHEEARRATRDARLVAESVLERLVAEGVVEAPPGDDVAGEGRGGVRYWTSPVRYQVRPDGSPIALTIHLSTVQAARFAALLEGATT